MARGCQVKMAWTKKYKKSIDCNNPKGFSQKAHCQARKLRRKGMKTKSEPIGEEAPANNVGGGNIAGMGVGPQGEPGLKMKQRLKYKRKNAKDIQDREGEIATLVRRAQPMMESNTGVFAGNTTFIVPSDMFHKARVEKRKGKHWKTYIGEDEHGVAIREYANKNRKKAIILQDANTGAMCYARYGAK